MIRKWDGWPYVPSIPKNNGVMLPLQKAKILLFVLELYLQGWRAKISSFHRKAAPETLRRSVSEYLWGISPRGTIVAIYGNTAVEMIQTPSGQWLSTELRGIPRSIEYYRVVC